MNVNMKRPNKLIEIETVVIIYIAKPIFCHSLQCYHCLLFFALDKFIHLFQDLLVSEELLAFTFSKWLVLWLDDGFHTPRDVIIRPPKFVDNHFCCDIFTCRFRRLVATRWRNNSGVEILQNYLTLVIYWE